MLDAARGAGAAHFVLLSAICVQKPLLEFQKAKLRFEEELQAASRAGDLTHSIVRPTAFFKSLAGQVRLRVSGSHIARSWLLHARSIRSSAAVCQPGSEAGAALALAIAR